MLHKESAIHLCIVPCTSITLVLKFTVVQRQRLLQLACYLNLPACTGCSSKRTSLRVIMLVAVLSAQGAHKLTRLFPLTFSSPYLSILLLLSSLSPILALTATIASSATPTQNAKEMHLRLQVEMCINIGSWAPPAVLCAAAAVLPSGALSLPKPVATILIKLVTARMYAALLQAKVS
jgi:hypothetical protein